MAIPTLKEMYEDLENRSTDEIIEMLNRNMSWILPRLERYGDDGLFLFAGFTFSVIAVDERLREEEYYVMEPFLKNLFGLNATFKDAKEIILEGVHKDPDVRESYRKLIDGLGSEDPELKNKMIFHAMLVSAIDGDVCRKERTYIESLL